MAKLPALPTVTSAPLAVQVSVLAVIAQRILAGLVMFVSLPTVTGL